MATDITHFSMFGYVYAGEAAPGIDQLARTGLRNCAPKPLDTSHVDCVVRDPSGAELWIGLKKGGDGAAALITMNPGFAGEGRVQLHIQADNSSPDWEPFEISRVARFRGEETPLIFDLADPTEGELLKPGKDVTVSLSAFSYRPELYADAAAFSAAQKKAGLKAQMAPELFIPSGMFFEKAGGALQEGAPRPTSYADFAGTVLKATLKTNTAGGARSGRS